MAENNQKTILIIEDELPQLKSLADEFTDEGFRVLQAQNGEAGLAMALREHPDIILLDMVMPVMDGLAMLKKLRESNKWGQFVSVIVLTNVSADQAAIKAFENLAYDFLIKNDHSMKEVVKIVKEKLRTVS